MADYTRVFDLIYHQQKTRPRLDSLAAKVNGSWIKFSTDEVIEKANQVSKALLKLGVGPGDTVALVSNNRPEWNFIDLGVQQIGAINVPVYPTISDKEYAYIFNDAQVKFCFLGNADLHDKISGIANSVGSLQEIFTFDEIPGARNWNELLEPLEDADLEQIEALKDKVTPDDLATLIYTSGTTGNPKGVMLTHKNLVSNVRSVAQVLPLSEGSRALSFLPLCHSFERTVSNSYIANGVSIYYAENLETIGDNLKEVKPEFFSTVPRLLEKVYEKIMAAGRELTGFKRRLFFWSVDLASQYDLHKDQGWWYNTRLNVARRLVFSKWREALGGEIVCICTGAAAIQPRLATLFTAGGIDVIEGYGLTETAPVLAVNRLELENRHIGTVGLPIPDVEIRIAEDGEILARGPNIMRGYYNKPDLTAEVIDDDGWFHTGDVGEFVKGKFLKITDRKKELFKTSGGKYVAPQPIENKFKESPLIEQIAVIGNDRKFVSALIVPSFLALEDYCKQCGLPAEKISTVEGRDEVLNHPQIKDEYDRQIAEFNKDINHVEQVKKYKLLPAEWSVESGELTPTMKPKRKIIYERYAGEIESLYGG